MEIKRIGPPRADETPVYIGAMHGFSINPERPSWIRVAPLEPLGQHLALGLEPSSDGPPLRIESGAPSRRDETPRFSYSSHRARRRPRSPLRFGEWLVRRELISPRELFRTLCLAQIEGLRIGDAIVEQRLMERGQVELEALQHHTFLALTGGEPLASCPL